MTRLVLSLFGLLLLTGFAGPVQAFGFPWYPLADDRNAGALERIPACTDGALVAEVINRFNEVERTYWEGRHQIVSLADMRQRGFHPQRDDKVARRWCEGRAAFADGTVRRVVLELAAGTGFVGLGYGFSTCVDGLDRHFAFAPTCRVLRHREF